MSLLSGEEIDAIVDKCFVQYMNDENDAYYIAFARAIEAAILAKLASAELPEPLQRDDTEHGVGYFTATQLHEAYAQGFAAHIAIEALQKEVSTLDVLLEECKMDWSGDVTQLKAEHKHEIDALQAKLDAMGKGGPVAPEQVEAAWRAGWASCRDAEYVGQEAEDEAWGMSQTCANADWESAAPKALAPLTEPERKKMWHDTFEAHSRWSAYEWFSHGIQRAEAAHGIGGAP